MRWFAMGMGFIGAMMLSGCGQLRFAPGEAMKENAWAHFRTTQLAADAARDQSASAELCGLTELSARQSEAFVVDYGTPKEMPAVETVEEVLSPANRHLATTAAEEASQRPDPWAAAEVLLEAALAAAGVVGGVTGSRIAAALRKARGTQRAMREIIRGNEVFKRNNANAAEAFKQAQHGQSAETKKLVAAIKAES